MLYIVIIIALIIFFIGYLKWKIVSLAYTKWMLDKEYPLPAEDELRERVQWASKNLFKSK